MVYGKTPKISSYLSFNIICKFQVLQVHRLNFLPQCSKVNALLELYLPESGRVTVGIIPEESLSSLCEFLCSLWFGHFFQFYNCFLRHGKISNNDSVLAKNPLSFFKTTKATFPIERKIAAKKKRNDKLHLFQIDDTQRNIFSFPISYNFQYIFSNIYELKYLEWLIGNESMYANF